MKWLKIGCSQESKESGKVKDAPSSQQLHVSSQRSCAPHCLFFRESGSSVPRESNLFIFNPQIVPDQMCLTPGVPWEEAKKQVGGDVHHVPRHGVVHASQAHVVLVPQAVAQLPAVVENLQQLGFLKHCAQAILPTIFAHHLNIKHKDILLGGKKQEGKRTGPAKESTFTRDTNLPCSSHPCHCLFKHIPHLIHNVKTGRCENGGRFVLVSPKSLSDATLNRTPAKHMALGIKPRFGGACDTRQKKVIKTFRILVPDDKFSTKAIWQISKQPWHWRRFLRRCGGSHQQLVHLHPVQVQKVAVAPSSLEIRMEEEIIRRFFERTK